MQVQVNSNSSTRIPEAFETRIRADLEQGLERFADRLTRIEIHLRDEHAHKTGTPDKCCQVEARIKSGAPISASHRASSMEQAIQGATSKLNARLDTLLHRPQERRH